MNSPKTFSNITPRRSKALPVVLHPSLGKCILISKEANHGRWSLFGGGNNATKNSEGIIMKQEKSRDAVIRELKEELGEGIIVEKIKDLGTIITNKSGKLIPKNSSERIKQRIFAILAKGVAQRDDTEIEGIGYYPLEEKYGNIRKGMRENMDEFAKKALIDFRKQLLDNGFVTGNIKISKPDLKHYNDFLKSLGNNRGIIGKLLNW